MTLEYLSGERIQGSSVGVASVATKEFDFSNNTNWELGDSGSSDNSVTIDTGNEYVNLYKITNISNTNRRVAYDLQTNDSFTMSDSTWRCDFELYWVDSSSGNSTGQGVGFSSANNQMSDEETDCIVLSMGGNSTTPAISMQNQDGTTEYPTGEIPVVFGATLYCRMERLSTTKCRFSVFTDSARTTHRTSSPQTSEDAGIASITGLDWLVIANRAQGGGDRESTFRILDVKIYNGQDDKATLITSYADSLGTAGNAASNSGDLVTSSPAPVLGTGCLNFDGDGGSPANDNIDCFAALDSMEGTGTVAMWVYNDVSQDRILWGVMDASEPRGIEVKIRDDEKIGVNAGGSGLGTIELASSATTPLTTWFHLAITQDGTNCKIYVNGTAGSAGTDNGDWIEDIGGADGGKFGCKPPRNNSAANEGFNGKLDDIGIWDRALTSTEINKLYNNNTSSTGGTDAQKCSTIPSGLKVYYNCDSATVINNLVDYSDLPEGTRFEEINTRKIYRMKDGVWVLKGVAA